MRTQTGEYRTIRISEQSHRRRENVSRKEISIVLGTELPRGARAREFAPQPKRPQQNVHW